MTFDPFPTDPGSPSENGSMEPKYFAFWRWLDTRSSSFDKVSQDL